SNTTRWVFAIRSVSTRRPAAGWRSGRPVRKAARSRSASAICSSSGLRRSTVSSARSGTTLGRPGEVAMCPTVARSRPYRPESTISRTLTTTCAAASPASRRSSVGVVPAWAARPRSVTFCQDRLHTRDHADRAALVQQDRSLFDVALHGGVGRVEADRTIPAKPDPGQLATEPETGGVGQVIGVVEGQPPSCERRAEHVGAEADPLLLCPGGDQQRASGRDALLVQ